MTKLALAFLAAGVAAIPALAQQPAPVPPPMPHAMPHAMPPGAHHMPGAMAVRSRAEVAAKVREHFAKLDGNRDGFVTRAEADAGRAHMQGMRGKRMAERMARRGMGAPRDRKGAFDRLDANKDGMISRQEFDAAPRMQQRRTVIVQRDGPGGPGGPAAMAPGGPRQFMMRMGGGGAGLHGRMFDLADANRDGRVSLQEATDAALRRFDTADVNRDGQLTPDERRQTRQRIMIERKPG